MYVKIINPATNGRKVYANNASAQRTVNYLSKEAKENEKEPAFFGSPDKGTYTPTEVVALIDNNHKGLGKDAAKFYSLVLSPSADEAAEMAGNSKALQQYTQQVMEAYAKNFKLKNGQELGEKDLVWAAAIHEDRKHRGTDDGKQGDSKAGWQTHLHVIVSARDADQKVTLNPLGKADRFNRVHFQAQAGALLDERLGRSLEVALGGPKPTHSQRVAAKAADITARAAANNRERKPMTPEQLAAKAAKIDSRIERINFFLSATSQLDTERVREIAKTRNHDSIFYGCLRSIERNAEKGSYPKNAYEFLATGEKSKGPTLDPLGEKPQVPAVDYTYRKRTVVTDTFQGLNQSVRQLSHALAPKIRTADVRSEAEKRRDYEQEL